MQNELIEEMAFKAGVEVRTRGNKRLIKSADIPALLDAADEAEVVLIRIEGFTIEGSATRPDMNAIADFSTVKTSLESIRASKIFFKEVNRPELWFEIVLKRLPTKLNREDIDPNHLWVFGGPVDSSTAGLRLFGDSLIPAEITDLLGCKPTMAHCKGDVLPDRRYHRIAKTGSWILDDDLPGPTEIGEKIVYLLSKVTDDLSVWANLSEKFTVDIFCGLFLDEDNRGFELSVDILKMLSERKITLDFDIYGSGNEED